MTRALQHSFSGLLSDQAYDASRENVSGTFSDNLSLPIHRWFKYTAGFSAAWVASVIRSSARAHARVLDPFAGSGTVLIEAEKSQAESIGLETQWFVARIARTKLLWRSPVSAFTTIARQVADEARKVDSAAPDYPDLIPRCYPQPVLQQLHGLQHSWAELHDDSPASELVWLAITAILRACSPVGTASWQYVLPAKLKSKSLWPFEAFDSQVARMAQDMSYRQGQPAGPEALLHENDARTCSAVADGWASLVITSPPYPNNYDYADATRLELCFWREIDSWGDLQGSVRQYLLRSCTQHVAPIVRETDAILQDSAVEPIRDELTEVCSHLADEREGHGGKKPYHTMIAAYFRDLGLVWQALRRVTTGDCKICFVIGDSAPYGVYVPVDRWLGELAVAAGFSTYAFEKIRDRNIKWKNRKHRVPLHEGRLWVE